MQWGLSEKVKMISISKEYDTDIITLFHLTGDFHYRSRWQEGVKSVEEVNHFLPRVGMRCRCVRDNGDVVIYASSYSFHPERIEFSETDEQRQNATYYLLEKISDNKTRLTVDYYMKKSLAGPALFRLTGKKKMEADFHQSLLNLDELIKEGKLTGV